MGIACCKPEPDTFATPGRVLGTAPPTGPRTSHVSRGISHTPMNPPFDSETAVGSIGTPGGKHAPVQAHAQNGDPNDARRRAAEAAERRLNASKNKNGKLTAKMHANKAKTQADLLQEASSVEVQARQLDANTAVLRHY